MKRQHTSPSQSRLLEAIAEARAAGRMGSARIPDSALMAVPDPTDTFIGKLVDEHAAGLAERSSQGATT